MKKTFAAAGRLALAVTFTLAAVPAAAVDLVPHRAVYAMRLATAKSASGISAADGVMTYQFADTCDGWTVENSTVINFVYNEGGRVATTWDFLTWESKDGKRYRFRVRSTRDGQVVEQVDGTASLNGGNGGKATFTQPEALTLKLPKGTMFPTHHTEQLLKVAEAAGKVGGRMFARAVFDGSGPDGLFDVSAMLGRPIVAPSPGAKPDSDLLKTPSWRVQMAFFPVESKDIFPEYEVGLRYHVNGVAQDVVQDFGDFSLKATLRELERLPRPEC